MKFCKGLAMSPSIRHLNLAFNSFGEMHGGDEPPAVALGEALRSVELRTLDLAENRVTIEAIDRLLDGTPPPPPSPYRPGMPRLVPPYRPDAEPDRA